jgi:membrane protease YdiL (CAAX protease family)
MIEHVPADGRTVVNLSGNERSLLKLVYSMLVLYLFLTSFSRIWKFHEARLVRENSVSAVSVLRLYSPLLALVLSFLGLLVVTLAYWPIQSGEYEILEGGVQEKSFSKKVVIGFLFGCGTFLVALPFLSHADSLNAMVTQIHYCKFCASLFLSMILMAFGIPVVVEIVFRRIAFETLRQHASLLPSILVSSTLSAVFWPVFNWPVALIFGIASCLIYHRYRSLVPCVVGNITISILSLLLYLRVAISTTGMLLWSHAGY